MQDHLGLFDTPPNRREIRFGLAIAGLLTAAFFLILPWHDIRLRQFQAFIPMIDAIMLLSELVIAILLYSQAAVFRSRALTVLATGYVLAALLLIPHALTSPGAFAPDGLLGAGVNTTAWIYTIRRAALPIAVILYVHLKRPDSAAQSITERPAEKIAVWVFAAIVLASAITILATAGHDLLPSFYLNRLERNQNYAVGNLVVLALYVAAMAVLLRKRNSVLDMWLLVALSGWVVQTLLNMPIQARFTLGWYCVFVMMLVSNLIVMLALLAETSWLYSRLALSASARRRERETRLLSMDAITAAISHEVGQPLIAVGLNASAGLNSLTRAQPDVEMAIRALRAISDDKQRVFDVINSVRAMFAKEPGRASEFSLNELVRETTSLLGRELASAKVTLELELDEALPPILADRVQMQRVLVNLATNAIESLGGWRRRHRRIVIRSVQPDVRNVMLEVSDTGVGIEPDKMERIFEAFFTTKATGTGLGLSLSRSIVEEHGGRLWASQGEEYGATFHLQLPRAEMPAL